MNQKSTSPKLQNSEPSPQIKKKPKHIRTYEAMIDKAEDDISKGRVHSQEQMDKWMNELD